MSGKFSFHDWKVREKVGEFCYRKPVGTLVYVREKFCWCYCLWNQKL